MTGLRDSALFKALGGRAEDVAPRLLGCVLESWLPAGRTVGRIVEVEAYLGPHDPASHAASRTGRTLRNAPMFGPPGTAYVYRSHGIHWCFNIVTSPAEFPAAVLVRALEPTEGTVLMARRRGRAHPLCAGPGRLAQAMGITGEMNGHRLTRRPLRLLDAGLHPGEGIGVSSRIGITRAADWPLRFFISDNPHLSRRESNK